jgi:hypothetical protein
MIRIEASEMRFLRPLLDVSEGVKTSTDERRHLGTEIPADEIQEYKGKWRNYVEVMRHEPFPEHAYLYYSTGRWDIGSSRRR